MQRTATIDTEKFLKKKNYTIFIITNFRNITGFHSCSSRTNIHQQRLCSRDKNFIVKRNNIHMILPRSLFSDNSKD